MGWQGESPAQTCHWVVVIILALARLPTSLYRQIWIVGVHASVPACLWDPVNHPPDRRGGWGWSDTFLVGECTKQAHGPRVRAGGQSRIPIHVNNWSSRIYTRPRSWIYEM
jgi:hypothetical protein